MRLISCVQAFFLVAVMAGCAGSLPLPDGVRQALVVTSTGGTGGTLERFERAGQSGAWSRVGKPVPVSLGRSGLAAGDPTRGLRPKAEGDGCTPTGVHPITGAFGTAPAFPTRMTYLATGPWTEAIDDPASKYYNRIVDRRKIASPDWVSSEPMLRGDHLYDLGLVTGFNTRPAIPGRGSCIFLHIWKSPGAPTSGCVAMARDDLESIVRWLDPAARPAVVIRRGRPKNSIDLNTPPAQGSRP